MTTDYLSDMRDALYDSERCDVCGGRVRAFRPVIDHTTRDPSKRYCPSEWHTVPAGAVDEKEVTE